ncbi:MAG: T9SS type A sorting domain-containing protein [Bacteroidales bacterium]|nr:T9SS type A sorting domain-containing protein [Bacteroidales bacterium]
MKRAIIFFTFLMAVITVQAQQPTGDTIFGRNPHYFYGWWPDEWFPLDTTIIVPETTYAIRNYDPVNMIYDIDTIVDSVPWFIYHSAYHRTRMRMSGLNHVSGGELVQLRHTDSALCIIGLAGAFHRSLVTDPKTDCTISDTDSRGDEYLLLCKELPDTFVCLRRERWSMETPARVMELPVSANGDLCCTQERYTDWTQIREYYFNTPIIVTGDFYVGGTYYNSLNSESCWTFYESLVTGCMTDTCPSKWWPGKFRDAGGNWSDYGSRCTNGMEYMLVFPIIGSMCPEVTDLRVTQSTSDSLLIEWGTDWHQASWELQCYPVGTAPDSAETIVCNHPTYLLTGLDSTQLYAVRVRSTCTYDSTYRSSWQLILVRKGMAVGINTTTSSFDDGILLRPNPADRQVTVSAPLPLRRVEVYDMAGRLVEAHQPSGTALQIDLKTYPTGTYLVKVTTANGTTTKKLVVR